MQSAENVHRSADSSVPPWKQSLDRINQAAQNQPNVHEKEEDPGATWDSLAQDSQAEPKARITWDDLKDVPFAGGLKDQENAGQKYSNEQEVVATQEKITQEDFEQRAIAISRTNWHEGNKHQRFIGSALQQNVELAFNDKLTSIDEIAAYADSGMGASTEMVDFNGKKIAVYHVNELPIKTLQTTINYKQYGGGSTGKIGDFAVSSLMNNPGFWESTNEDAKRHNADKDDTMLMSNTICMSYVDEGISSKGAVDSIKSLTDNKDDYPVTYCFTHIQPDSIVHMRRKDMASDPLSGDEDVKSDNGFIYPDDFIINSPNVYNELVMRRYDKVSGELLYRPDYIKTIDGHITAPVLKHAAYFGIPIVDIDSKNMERSREQHLVDELAAIDDRANAHDVRNAARLIFKHYGDKTTNSYNYGKQEKRQPYRSELQRVVDLARSKTLDWLEDELRNAIEDGGESSVLSDIEMNNIYQPWGSEKELKAKLEGEEIDIYDAISEIPEDYRLPDIFEYENTTYQRLAPLFQQYLQTKKE